VLSQNVLELRSGKLTAQPMMPLRPVKFFTPLRVSYLQPLLNLRSCKGSGRPNKRMNALPGVADETVDLKV
jgi:hypothetical protein